MQTQSVWRFLVGAVATLAIVLLASVEQAWAQVSPAGGGANKPPTAARASSPSPETGKQLEPQLFGFIFIGGGIIVALAVVIADRKARSDFAGPGRASRF
jgi:hypothetical protein